MPHVAYSPASRLLTLLDLLQARPRLSAEEVAGALQVNTRSARRYITMLQDMGIPVESRRGRYGGYALRPGYKLPPLMLTDDEALAVTLCLLAAPRLGLTELRTATAGALAKLERVLPLATRQRVQAIREAVALDTTAQQADAATRLDVVAVCSAAAQQGRRLRMTYRRDEGALTERLFDCYGVAHHADHWYAIGFCHLRDDMRVFRLDRVEEIMLCDERFSRPVGFDSLEYAITAFAAIPDTWLAQALLDTSFAEACRRIPADFATLEETADGILLRAYDASLDHAARFLIGLGCPFTVLGPPELLQMLSDIARDISTMIARSTGAPSS